MDNSDSGGPNPDEPRVSPEIAPPRKQSGNLKWIAVIIALLVVIGAMGIIMMIHPSTGTGSTVSIVNAPDTATLNTPYSFEIQTNGAYNNVTVNWGDSSIQTYSYQGATDVAFTHTYSSPGNYFVFYTVNFGSSNVTNQQALIPVHISSTIAGISPYVSYGLMQLQTSNTQAAPLVNNSMVYAPGTSLSFIDGYYSAPSASGFAVLGQSVNIYHNESLVNQTVLPYSFSMADGQYELPNAQAYTNYTFANPGIYTVGIDTATGVPITTENVPTTVTNTSTASYAKGQTVEYGNSTQLNYGGALTYTSSPPLLTYLAGLNVTQLITNSAMNVSYSYADLTYTTNANLVLPVGKVITVAAGANFTVNGYTNLTFLNNGTYVNAAGTQSFNDTTSAYAFTNGEYVNFTQATSFTVYNASKTESLTVNAGSTFTYDQGSAPTGIVVEYLNDNSVLYNKDANLMYIDPYTNVTYLDATSVTITMDVAGVSAPITVGQVDTTQGVYSATFYTDVAVFSSAKQYTTPVSGSTFTSAEVAPGGYTSLDPQIAFYTLDSEVLYNTMLTLVGYNGSSTSSFTPMVATTVPSVANGGINAAHTNYTFHVNTNLMWQDGSHLSVYDAYYGIVRDLLFTNGHPGTGGYLLAAYLLPAPYYDNVDYTNITNAVTYSNATQNITLHFQDPMPASLVFQLIADNEASPIDANWTIAHGAGIQFTPSGFQNYTAFGSSSDYNTYLQNNIMADGPYEISYNLPGSQIVLVKNPNYVAPGSWFPAPTITTVVLQYLTQPSTAFLELESGAAQSAIGIPATPYWPQIQSMNASGFLQIHKFPTLGIFFFNFNMLTNETMLHTIVHNANVPPTLFVNPNMREVFNFAFNYSQYFAQDIGNALYNTTFQSGFVGMLPPGMLWNQSISQLQQVSFMKSTYQGSGPIHNWNGTAFSDMVNANMYWNYFLNDKTTDGFAANGLSMVGGKVMYKGAPLVIPIFVPVGDSPDAAAVSQWGAALSQIIPGASFPVETATYTQIFATWALAGGNPMPVSWGGWAPDYVYPTDYIESMSLPSNLSTYMSAATFNPWFVGGGSASGLFHNPTPNTTEQAQLNRELGYYNNATSNGSNPAAAQKWFQMTNYEVINTSINVNLGQPIFYWTISGAIKPSSITDYQENVMIGAGNELLYNLLQYS